MRARAGDEAHKFYVDRDPELAPTPWMDALARAISVLLHGAGESQWPEESYVRGFREGLIAGVGEVGG